MLHKHETDSQKLQSYEYLKLLTWILIYNGKLREFIITANQIVNAIYM
jgi:hypothetical protein